MRQSATGLHTQPPSVGRGRESLPATAAMGGILACLGMLGAAGSFVTAFDLPMAVESLLVACLLLPALWTAVCFLGWLRLPLTLLLLGLCGFALWWSWGPFVQGFLHTTNHLFLAISQQTPWELPQYFTEPVTAAVAEGYMARFGLLILAPWGALAAWSAAWRGSFLLTALVTGPFLALPLYVRLEPAPWAVACLLLCWAALGFARLTPGGRRGGAVGTAFACLPALALCLMALLLAVPREGYTRPPEMEDLRVQAEETAQEISEQVGQWLSGQERGGFLSHDRRRRSFWNLGSISFSGRTDLRVKVDQAEQGPLYLKGFTGAVYDSSGWSALPDPVLEEISAATGSIQPQNLTAATLPVLTPLELTVENHVNPRMVYAPRWLMSTPEELPDVVFRGDGGLRARPFLGLDTYTLRYGAFILYSDTIRPGSPWRDPETAGEQMRAYEDAALSYYTQVPQGLEGDLDRALAEMPQAVKIAQSGLDGVVVAIPSVREGDRDSLLRILDDGAASENWKAYLVQEYIQSTGGFSYTLTPGDTPPGQDFTAHFLHESKQGYCVYFATAGTLLLRRLGVPARYCEGYLVTRSDLAKGDADGFSTVADRRAHAWVEYYTEEFGWVTMDCTPGFQERGSEAQPNDVTNEVPPTPRPTEAPTPTPTAAVTPTPTVAVPTATPTPTPVPTAGTTEPGQAGWDLAPLWAVLKWALALGTALLLVWLRREVVLRLRRRRFEQPDRNRAALHMYVLLERLTPWAGPVEPLATELAEKARFSSHRLTEEERETMAALLRSAQHRAEERASAWWLRYGICVT